jgi:HD-GYP domain-containing protein (c-di-GMP phosphodiesterase class II)
VVGVPEALAFAPADRQLARNLGLLAVATLLALVAAWALGDQLIVRPVRRLVQAARGLSEGDLTARAGPPYSAGELGHLGQAFDQMADDLQDAYLATVQVLAASIGARDPGGLEHVERVSGYAVALGREVGLPEPRLVEVQLTAALHDVGRIAIADAILRKEGPLDPDEKAQVREHPLVALRLLERVPFLAVARPGVRGHHEWYDGGGYPVGLAGDSIPAAARIVAVADGFDAMTAPPPAGAGRSVAEALGELQRCAGTQFDPRLVQLFVDAVVSGRIVPQQVTVPPDPGAPPSEPRPPTAAPAPEGVRR